MEIATTFVMLFGGLGLFLYGTNLTSEGLQKETAAKMNAIIQKLTANKYSSVLTGIILTVFLQSSSATTVLLVSFVSASILSLSQALGIILGAAIGTTFTVQLIAFKVTDYALFFVGLGAFLKLFGTSDRWKNIGLAVLGFGFLFYGMVVMSNAMLPLRSYPLFIDSLISLSERPILMLLVATVLTSIIQSSAATIALAMSLAFQGAIPVEATLPIVFGANVGTTTTALISSLTSSREAKKVAIAHLIFKVVGVLIFLPFLDLFHKVNIALTTDIPRQIANAHTIFNVVNTITFLPFTAQFARFMDKLLPPLENEEKIVKHLDERVIDVPDLAFQLARNEIIHMGELVKKQLEVIPDAIRHRCINSTKLMIEKERKIDILHKAITKYLTTITQKNLTESQSETEVRLLYIANDFEHLGDVAISMTKLANKMIRLDLSIPEADWNDLLKMQSIIGDNFEKVVASFKNEDYNLAGEVIKSHPKALRLEKNLRYNHFLRMTQLQDNEVELSSVHLDIINNYLRINSHLVSIAQAVMGNI
ncbi:MAG: Na/Pi cotransporter family protein [Bacillota bacterium]|nr:Na/Pi cotransporter family protein [Bacillota bacterium]